MTENLPAKIEDVTEVLAQYEKEAEVIGELEQFYRSVVDGSLEVDVYDREKDVVVKVGPSIGERVRAANALRDMLVRKPGTKATELPKSQKDKQPMTTEEMIVELERRLKAAQRVDTAREQRLLGKGQEDDQ